MFKKDLSSFGNNFLLKYIFPNPYLLTLTYLIFPVFFLILRDF